MILDCAKPGEVESIVIKEQSNEQSQGRVYTNQNFIPISQRVFSDIKKHFLICWTFRIPNIPN